MGIPTKKILAPLHAGGVVLYHFYSGDSHMHRLLERQLEEHLPGGEVDVHLKDLLSAIAAEYARADADRAALERLELAIRGSEDGLWDWEIGASTGYFSARYNEMLGLAPGTLTKTSDWMRRLHEDDLHTVRRRFDAHVAGRTEAFEAEFRIRHHDGGYRWMVGRGVAIRDDDGAAKRIAGAVTDITTRKEVELQLRLQAYHDESTGYPNRHLLLDRLRRAIARQEEHDRSFALVAIAIDAFDKIADSFGHELCEATVAAVADRIAGFASPIDTLARIRKDHLCLLIESAPTLTAVLSLTDSIQRAVQNPMQLEGEEVFTSLSLGIVSSDGVAQSPEDYLHEAVMAMNRAGTEGGGRRAVFDLEMHQAAVERLGLERELRRAITQDEFVVYYQPIVSLQSGTISGFEALLRWNHPDRGILSPASFIDVAEETGHLSAIFDQVLPRILKQVARWQARGRGDGRPFVNVNLSRTQLLEADLLPRIDAALESVSLAPRTVGFEMTESVMVDDAAVIDTLRALANRGVRLLLDDFGTGYSCLSNLGQFPLDSVKIDKSFVSDVGKTTDAGEIARAITNLAHCLAMDVTVEGIETEPQLRFAYNLGCEYAQGYHFATPVPAEEATKMLGQKYRTSLTPPSSGKRPRNPQARGRVLVIDADVIRHGKMCEALKEAELEVVGALDAHEGRSMAEIDMPDVAIVAMDLPGMGTLELCRALQNSNETASIPLLLLIRPGTPTDDIAACLEVGAADCVMETTPHPILAGRLASLVGVSHARRKLRTMAMTDEQTGVFTRRFLFQALRRSIKSIVRTDPRGLACLVVDADDFRSVNETRGHIEADGMLQRIAATIDRTTRETDLVARFGGAEFVVLLHDTDHAGALEAAEKIRLAVEKGGDTTVSIGGAMLTHASIESVRTTRAVDELISTLLRGADTAMYAAKAAGKNCVVFAERDAVQTA